ncbi:cytidine/deoxycytidylate deaminase/NUDIX/methyltransferase domains protein [Cutibacterium acnes JCM 18918]|nr:cytidine/deoxycytidylate deaminase/NUDIX/methyltransferase domains protein [Cutibacterium acnes JCM 18918]
MLTRFSRRSRSEARRHRRYAPSHGFPPHDINGTVDTTRLAWLTHPKVHATEIQLASDMAAIVACRLSARG